MGLRVYDHNIRAQDEFDFFDILRYLLFMKRTNLAISRAFYTISGTRYLIDPHTGNRRSYMAI